MRPAIRLRVAHLQGAPPGTKGPYVYRIAGKVCGNYILRFVVKSKVCRLNVCGLHNTSLHVLMHLHQHFFADKMFAEFRQNRKLQNLIPRNHFRLHVYGI